jgi:hypothetical protein
MTRINGEPGTYIVYDLPADGVPSITPYSSEIQGLRAAMLQGAQMIFVPYGTSLTDAIENGRKAAEDPAGDRQLLTPKRRPRKTAKPIEKSPDRVEVPGQEHDPEAEVQL